MEHARGVVYARTSSYEPLVRAYQDRSPTARTSSYETRRGFMVEGVEGGGPSELETCSFTTSD